MEFNVIKIKTNSLGADMLAGALLVEGISSFSITDPRDFINIIDEKSIPFDYYEDNLIPEDITEVEFILYLANNTQGATQYEFLLNEITSLKNNDLDCGSLEVTVEKTDDSEWADNWKKYFTSMKVGNKFIVKPSWEAIAQTERFIIEIDPESAFGSGQHETTKLCLERLEEVASDGASVLDMGCGSGILGIGATLLGAKSVVAVDIDENAVHITERNYSINHTEGKLAAYCGDVLSDKALHSKVFSQKYNIILANIVADIIIEMLPDFFNCLACGGSLILSGIINSKKDKVELALKNYSLEYEVFTENDWVCIKCFKPATIS
ncbi:50S ribosomal protein L11 methyltransferase [Eubacteriales bacterium OttesenSCG-928-G02]|nr:50S ribosomal protein L11 methyltransferase [Eubacteriales bacterium OttesenSCG-928-G02]